MRKLFKKSLACLLAAIFCVTLCVAAVPASAEAPTYSTNAVEAKAGETVNIDFTVSNFINVKGAMIKLTLPEVVASITDVNLNGADLAAYDAETGNGYYQVNGKEIKFLSLFGYAGELDAVATLTFNITAVIADDAAEGTYTYADPYFSVTEDGETLVDVTGTFGEFKVVPAVTEPAPVNLGYTTTFAVSDTLAVALVIPEASVKSYADFEIMITKDYYSVGDYNVNTTTVSATKAQSTLYYGSYYATIYGFALTDLCLDISIVVNCYDAEGNLVAVSETNDTTLKDLAISLHDGSATTGQGKKTRTLVADLLNLATESELYFAGRFPNSALAAVPAEDRPNYGFDQTYATVEVPEATVAAGQTSNNGATITGNVSILLSPAMAYIITTNESDTLTGSITYYDAFLKQEVPVDIASSEFVYYYGMYFYNYEKLPLYSSNAVLSFTLRDGDTVLGTHEYTVEQFAAANLNDATIGAVMGTVAKFGASARAYFGI